MGGDVRFLAKRADARRAEREVERSVEDAIRALEWLENYLWDDDEHLKAFAQLDRIRRTIDLLT